MFGFGMPELIIIGVIVMMIFGVGKLPEIGNSVGKAINSFRKAADGKDVVEITPEKKSSLHAKHRTTETVSGCEMAKSTIVDRLLQKNGW